MNFTKSALNKEIIRISQLAEVKRIRVHDLRHSHTALLIELGYGTHAIADRLGDTPEVVDRTYAHLYPSTAKSIADELNKHKSGIVVPQTHIKMVPRNEKKKNASGKNMQNRCTNLKKRYQNGTTKQNKSPKSLYLCGFQGFTQSFPLALENHHLNNFVLVI